MDEYQIPGYGRQPKSRWSSLKLVKLSNSFIEPRGTIDNAYKHIETYQQDSIHVPTNDVSVVQEEAEELHNVPVVLTEVEVHPIGGPYGLDDHNDIEDDSEETDQEEEEVVFEGASLHSCGSIPMTEHRRRLKEKLGKDLSLADLYQHTHKRKNGDGAYVCAKAQKVVDTMNELRQTQTEASDAELWLEATGGVKRGGYVYGFGSDTQHYFSEASKKSKSQARASSSNAALMAEIQEMREENKMFREENKFIREELSKMGAIFAQFCANPEFLSSFNVNNSGSPNSETQAPSNED
nr:putative transposase En/Spm [Ipomoea batatas]